MFENEFRKKLFISLSSALYSFQRTIKRWNLLNIHRGDSIWKFHIDRLSGKKITSQNSFRVFSVFRKKCLKSNLKKSSSFYWAVPSILSNEPSIVEIHWIFVEEIAFENCISIAFLKKIISPNSFRVFSEFRKKCLKTNFEKNSSFHWTMLRILSNEPWNVEIH